MKQRTLFSTKGEGPQRLLFDVDGSTPPEMLAEHRDCDCGGCELCRPICGCGDSHCETCNADDAKTGLTPDGTAWIKPDGSAFYLGTD